MIWNPEIGWEAIFTLFAFLAGILGLFYTAIQVRQNTLTQRASFLLALAERYFNDNTMRKFFYRLDSNKWVFDLETFWGVRRRTIIRFSFIYL